jgi:hypothetical protein
MMEGLGFAAKDFEQIRPLPASRAYRAWLDRVSKQPTWVLGAAALTIFVEGSVKDRKELREPSKPKTAEEIETTIKNHPLVRYHGNSPDCMDLIRAHQLVESGHRHDAYDMVTQNASSATTQRAILSAVKRSLRLWLTYRDVVAKACGLKTVMPARMRGAPHAPDRQRDTSALEPRPAVDMTLIPAGEYRMGTAEGSDGRPTSIPNGWSSSTPSSLIDSSDQSGLCRLCPIDRSSAASKQ